MTPRFFFKYYLEDRKYGCPFEMRLWFKDCVLYVRPFSSYAQGGDRRDENWRREQEAKWTLLRRYRNDKQKR